MGVDRPGEAVGILKLHGYHAAADDGSLVVDGCGVEMASAANRILVERGVAVHAIASEQASLESMFLELTERV